jgi:hypothetical protein
VLGETVTVCGTERCFACVCELVQNEFCVVCFFMSVCCDNGVYVCCL